jgi:hypothetical protein
MSSHVEQSGDSAGGIVRVESTENHMARKRRMNGYLGRLNIPDFTNHNDIRVLTHNMPESVCKREPDLRLHLDLVYAVNLVLNRIFNRYNFPVSRIYFVQ